MKWSSHPGVDPKCSNSFSDNSVVLEPEAIEGIGNRQAFRAASRDDRERRELPRT